LSIGTSIDNSAAIFFDFNKPIITNTVVNTIPAPNQIIEQDVLVCVDSANAAPTVVNLFGRDYIVSSDTTIRVIEEFPLYDLFTIFNIEFEQNVFDTTEVILATGGTYQGQTYNRDTVLRDTFEFAVNGTCDSIVTTFIRVVTSTSSVASNTPQLSIYPNPTNSDLTITVGGAPATQWRFELYGVDGRSTLLETWAKGAVKNAEQRFVVDMSTIAPGWYTLVARSGKQVLYEKVVKLE